jgi:hypothetical protein
MNQPNEDPPTPLPRRRTPRLRTTESRVAELSAASETANTRKRVLDPPNHLPTPTPRAAKRTRTTAAQGTTSTIPTIPNNPTAIIPNIPNGPTATPIPQQPPATTPSLVPHPTMPNIPGPPSVTSVSQPPPTATLSLPPHLAIPNMPGPPVTSIPHSPRNATQSLDDYSVSPPPDTRPTSPISPPINSILSRVKAIGPKAIEHPPTNNLSAPTAP